MKASQACIDLIKKFEGFRGTAYRDPVGIWTIGYGNTDGVKEGDTCTEYEAEGWLKSRCAAISMWIDKNLNPVYHFLQCEHDALVSFAYNCGTGNLRKLTGDGTRSKAQIAEKILEYNKAGGKTLQGLVRRRTEERAMFLGETKNASVEEILKTHVKKITAVPLVNYRIRQTPNGAIIGGTDGKLSVVITGEAGDWYKTDSGYISKQAFPQIGVIYD